MAYFSNGFEAAAYNEAFCCRCEFWHEELGCPVWAAHELWGRDECDKPDSVLDRMIPRTEDGLGNGRCFCFVERDAVPPGLARMAPKRLSAAGPIGP